MGFSLTIAEGQERGREYTFNQPEVSVGRTSDNDIVLQDAGISRKHCKIREDDNRYFIEDLGSANGTKVNGGAITAEEEVQDGDEVAVGPVVFAFTAMPNAGENSTRIFNPAELEKKMADTKKAREVSRASAASNPKSRAATSMSPAIGSKRPVSGSKPGGALVKPGGKSPVKAPPPGAKAASERLAAKRDAKTPIAKLKLWYSEQPAKVQKGITAGGAVVGMMALGIVALKLFSGPSGPIGGGFSSNDESKTVFELGTGPTQDCYGNDQSVNHTTVDKAQFSFNFPVTAKKAIATLHFTQGAIQRSEEVEIEVNTARMGVVDRSFGDDMRAQDVSLTTKYLKANDKNLLVFDNLKNPPGNETWKICKVWVEVQQLPAGSAQELREEARKYIGNGDRKFEDRKIGAANLFEAWTNYKTARLYLEAMDERVDEYDVVKGNIQKCEKELNEQCAKIMLQGAASEKTGKEGDAIKIYKGGQSFFPNASHPCYQQLHDALGRLE